MTIFIAILYNLAIPYWSVLQKELFAKKFSPLTIVHSSNLIGHPIGIAALIMLGIFAMPTHPLFYMYWFLMIVMATIGTVFRIWGLAKTKFFAVKTLSSIGFIFTALTGIFIVGEKITLMQTSAIGVAITGVLFFAWPKRAPKSKLIWDKGILFVLLSLIFGAIAAAFYKLSSYYAPDFHTFLTGRFVGDLIGWSFVWIVIVIIFHRKNPFIELKQLLSDKMGLKMAVGFAFMMLLASWLIYKLPLTTVVMLGTLSLPTSYLWGRFKYGDILTPRMAAGTALIVTATFLFLFY